MLIIPEMIVSEPQELVYLSANCFSVAQENGIQSELIVFCFPKTLKTDLIFIFRFAVLMKNRFDIHFSYCYVHEEQI